MMNFKSNTIEGYVTKIVLVASVLLWALVFLLLWQYGVHPWNLGVILAVLAFAFLIFGVSIRKKILSAFDRALLHIEAVKVEDYNQYARSPFAKGTSWRLHESLKGLSSHLQTNKARYDQHAFLLYQLIDQLNTPMMVFNKKFKLTYANAAFALIFEQPWQMYRLASPAYLGLEKIEDNWQLTNTDQQWQISESKFIDEGESHHLLVFTNIDSAIRASQIKAWQQIIRVLGHEIRNSLTPVSSLAESLSSKLDSPREQEALNLITDRCHHLQDFVNRYSSLSQHLNLNKQQLDLEALCAKVKTLEPELLFTINLSDKTLWADEAFFEQVMINLIKNAKEAGATEVNITARRRNDKLNISISDNGHGFSNPDNLFVPLYTTKPKGQGIGLSFCRNIIEQHNGSIQLTNNESSGVTVSISLPLRANH